MVPEATEKHQGQEFDLPAAVYRRRAWRPAALQGVESVLSSISRRKEPLDRRTARLTAWYEQLARRGQPFTGWSQPLTTEEIGGNNTQPSYDSVQPGSRTALREPEVISEVPSADANVTDTIVRPLAQDQRSATHLPQLPGEPLTPQRPRLLLRSVSGPIHTAAESTPPGEVGNVSDRSATVERPIEGAVEPVVLPGHPTSSGNPVAPSPAAKETPLAAKQTRLAAKDGRVATEKWRRATPMATVPQPHGEQSFVRPAMRLAILRPINTVTDTMLRSESEPISSGSSGFSLLTAEMKDFPALEGLAIGGQPAFQTRLVSSVSPFPRQEVRGGFPTSVKTEIRLDGDISFDGRVAGPASDTSASGNNLSLESALLAGSPPSGRAATQLEIAKSSGAIERLIDRTVLPVPLPGLQIRLVKPDDSASAAQRSANDVTEGGRSTIGLPNAQAPVPAAPPPLDINAVADKVYQTLQRRHQLERERRGLY